MSTVQIEPPPDSRRRRPRVVKLSENPDTRSIQVGIVATILIHLLLYFVGPYLFEAEFVLTGGPEKQKTDEFNITLEPDMEVPEAAQKEDPFRFVEVNPEVPDNEPDDTNNFGAQNQQVAQEVPDPDGNNDRPSMEGQTEIPSTQIVDGELRPPQPPTPSQPPTPQTDPQQAAAEAAAAAPRPQQNPLSGTEEDVGEDPEGIGTRNSRFTDSNADVPEPVEGVKDAPQTADATSALPIDPNQPRPRPSLNTSAINARPAIFEQNPIGTANVGPVAADARWSNYGQYLQTLISAVQLRWDEMVSRSGFYPTRGSKVFVTFVLNKAGEVSSIKAVEGTAGDVATNWCVLSVSPFAGFSYGAWTTDMVALLGDEQELTFVFLYR